MYYPYFITYIAVGFIISILVFTWAIKNHQFRDQDRARFIPLKDEEETGSTPISRLNRFEAFVLGGLACAGLLATAAVLFFALLAGGD
jgi:nitrogen fixation-related uncharacterized protein